MRHNAPRYRLTRWPYWLAIVSLLAVLVFVSTDVMSSPDGGVASGPTATAPEHSDTISGVGDPIPRVQCLEGYLPTVYAEGLASPDGLALSPDGILFVAEEAAGQVSRVESYGSVMPVLSGLHHPEGIAFDAAGNLYVVEDVAAGRVVKMATDGEITTLATDREAPEGVVWAPDGTLYITESNFHLVLNPLDFRTRITAISPVGEISTVRVDMLFWSYSGITLGPEGSLYVANEASGALTSESVFVVEPTAGSRAVVANGLVVPEGLRFSASVEFPLYVAEEDVGNGRGRLSRVNADGTHTPFCTGFRNIEDVVLDAAGRLYVSEDSSGSIIRIEPAAPDRAHPHAIILFIGDGMGEAHRIAGRWSAVGQNGALVMDAMPYGNWSRTASADDPITDSAAAATALATGVKTDNGVIGMDPHGNPLTTILERAKARGMAVGLVTNTPMAGATPAAFAAHVVTRTMMTEIARQMLDTGVNVLLGGGEDEFLPTSAGGCYPEPGERTDGRDLISEAVAMGYAYVCTAEDLTAVVPTSTDRLLGLFADERMSRPFSPSLAEMTQKAIDILSQDPDGFFLMVEGGQIDWAAHANDAANVISDTVGLDEAIAAAQAYASTAGDTLIIVTADHETGGMQVSLTSSGAPGEDGPFSMPGGIPFFVNWTTDYHTGMNVPTTAQGPWSDLLVGVYENTFIHDVMRLALEGPSDLSLTKMAVPPRGSLVAPGDQVTYTLVLTHSDSADAEGLALVDTLPGDVSYVADSVRVASGWAVVATPPPALVLRGTLPAGETVTATFGVTVSDVASGTFLVNSAQVMTGGITMATSTATHRVVAAPELAITKTARPDSGSIVAPGDRITYTVTVLNSGGPAGDVIISDAIDLSRVTLVVSRTTQGVLSGPSPVRLTGLDLEPGQRVTLSLGVDVVDSVSGVVITNTASLTSKRTQRKSSNLVVHLLAGADWRFVHLPLLLRGFGLPAPAPNRR